MADAVTDAHDLSALRRVSEPVLDADMVRCKEPKAIGAFGLAGDLE
jgi:hypothetical protein